MKETEAEKSSKVLDAIPSSLDENRVPLLNDLI